MADLQCPARLFVARGVEEPEASRLGDRLAGERIAHVYTSPRAVAVQAAGLVAARFGTGVTVREELVEASAGGESEGEVLVRFSSVLEEIADAHRGEAVLVLSHASVMDTVLPALVGRTGRGTGAEVVHLERDADGWVALS